MDLHSLENLPVFFQKHIFTSANFFQTLGIVFGLLLMVFFNLLFKKTPKNLLDKVPIQLKRIGQVLLTPLLWSFIQWTIVATSQEFNWDYRLSHIAAKFITAWLCTRGVSLAVTERSMKRLTSTFIYVFTALSVLGLISPILALMESVALNVGDLHISLFSVVKGIIVFYLLLWSTIIVSRWVEKKFKRSKKIEPSLQELFTKLIRTSLIMFSILLTLGSLGIDMSVFAVFGGTIGVGIGFGLQKVVSNLICGIILLLDRSIKPGDVIALDQGKSYGEINRLGARCVSVRTRSGKEHLIPNEEFIIHKSENWSLSDSLIRLPLPMRAGLDSDVPLVMQLLLDAAEGVSRVLKDPAPGARLRSFSESAIEFELRVWINDPQRGVSKVKSDIYLNIWNLFKKNRITIPHPQRDLHISDLLYEKIESRKNPFLGKEKLSSPENSY